MGKNKDFKELDMAVELVKYATPQKNIRTIAIIVAALSILFIVSLNILDSSTSKQTMTIHFCCGCICYSLLFVLYYAEKKWGFLAEKL